MKMALVIIELLLFVSLAYIFYQCCIKGRLSRRASVQEDLTRFRRQNQSEREDSDGASGSQRTSRQGDVGNESGARGVSRPAGSNAAAARTELIKKNLFSKAISREDSVKELSQLLAISRGNTSAADDYFNDEEMGVVAGVADEADGSDPALESPPATIEKSCPIIQDAASTSSPSSCAPTDPPTPSTPMSTSTDTPTQSSTTENNTTNPNPNKPVQLGMIRNLWSDWVQNSNNSNDGRENNINQMKRNSSTQQPQSQLDPQAHHHHHHLECSICLENFLPNNTISWAKDGGDSTNNSEYYIDTNYSSMGCDHIFHEECFIAWLQQHDECPLCRRKVVHADAELRFAGWEGR